MNFKTRKNSRRLERKNEFQNTKKTRRLERKVARRLQRKTHAVIAKFAFLMNGIKPNYSKIAKQFNCDARTVKRYFLNCQNLKRKPRVVVKVLDAYEELVIEKLELGANAYSIFNFIKKQGYKGGYTTVKNFCAKYKNDKQYKATIRFETNPGVQAQVDWKERFK